MINSTRIEKVGKLNLPDPQYGDFKLSVFPFENTGSHISLPVGFEIWEDAFNELLGMIPLYDSANQ